MAKYRAKQLSIIEAEPFLPPLQIPKGVINVYETGSGDFVGEVWTYQGQKIVVKQGEWIVKDKGDNCYYPIANDVFIEKYELDNGICECCKTNYATTLHTCPRKMDLHGDNELCNCCNECQDGCRESI